MSLTSFLGGWVLLQVHSKTNLPCKILLFIFYIYNFLLYVDVPCPIEATAYWVSITKYFKIDHRLETFGDNLVSKRVFVLICMLTLSAKIHVHMMNSLDNMVTQLTSWGIWVGSYSSIQFLNNFYLDLFYS